MLTKPWLSEQYRSLPLRKRTFVNMTNNHFSGFHQTSVQTSLLQRVDDIQNLGKTHCFSG